MTPDSLTALLGETLLKSAFVLLVVALVIFLARRFSSSQKHLWWMIGFAACILLPALLFLPEWKVLPTASVEKPQFSGEVELPVSPPGGATLESVLVPLEGTGVGPALSLVEILSLAWLAGCLFILLRSVAVTLLLHRLERSGRQVPEKIVHRFRELRSDSDRNATVRIFLSNKVTTPFTWGIWQPRIVLPDTSVDWPDSDLDMILAHEWEHVRRRDAIAVMLSRVFLALNWINPLAWIANRHATRQREDACDEAVMRRGFSFDSYADLLYRQAASASHSQFSSGATAVVEGNTIAGRIRLILRKEGKFDAIESQAFSRILTGALLILFIGISVVGYRDSRAQDESEKQINITTRFVEEGEDKEAETERILKAIILPKVEFNDLPFRDAIAYLGEQLIAAQKARGKDSRIIAIRYIEEPGRPGGGGTKISLELTQVPFYEALRYTAALAQMEYEVTQDGNINVSPMTLDENFLFTNVYALEPDFMKYAGGFDDAKAMLRANGIQFGQGTSAIINSETSQLIIRNTRVQIDVFEELIAEFSRSGTERLAKPDPGENAKREPTLRKVKSGWEDSPSIDLKKNPELTGTVEKLKKTVIPRIDFDELPLRDALQFIQGESMKHDPTTTDPDKVGINLILEGLPEGTKIEDIKITLRLTNVSLAEALRYTLSLARMKYLVEPDAIVIRPITPVETGASGKSSGSKGAKKVDRENDPETAVMVEKLQKTILPGVEFNQLPLTDALEYLYSESVRLDQVSKDPGKKGVKIILDGVPKGAKMEDIKITLRLTNIPLAEAFRYTASLAGMEYEVEPHAVVLRPVE